MKFYLVDYWDIIDNCRRIYRTNLPFLAFEKILEPLVSDWCMYVGCVVDGLFYPQRLVSRSATYTGV